MLGVGIGCGVNTTWERLIEGECGVRAISPDDLKMNSFDLEVKSYTFDQLTSKVAAIVPCGSSSGEFDDQLWLNSKVSPNLQSLFKSLLMRRNRQYYLFCPDVRVSFFLFSLVSKRKLHQGVSLSAGTGSISDIFDASRMICWKVTACATGAHSIGDAARMIQFGDTDVMVAGGTEASIDALSIAGFCRLRTLSTKYNSKPHEASRPFDCSRDGFVIGDAHHITQPHIGGRGAVLAMTHSLKQSGLQPSQVNHINAHATSTPLGDAAEANAIKCVFSDQATSGALSLSSTKSIAPLRLNLSKPDPVFNDGFIPLTTSKEMTIKDALSNSFGFGGTNSCLLFTFTN
ncbi:hypothetical protein RND71_013175 [Anisodus tanguticus]|uniref:beta-ketoacyl-[acyl-carrier-protein] synthase I n=1 Tax=Anisodus tanguticus TaxID=243964 RepID=A0AAE1VGR4_9SOLA|nr:hypothetical protein RND71_013175 [Anisodus tanguticus]